MSPDGASPHDSGNEDGTAHFEKKNREIEQDAEMMRLQILGDPNLMRQLHEVRYRYISFGPLDHDAGAVAQTQPELANAVQSNPARFAELLRQTRGAEMARQTEIERLNADPFDVEAQRRIEEAIRHQAVMENLEHALEYSPESFGRVTML